MGEDKKYDFALKILEFGIELFPDSAILHYGLGNVYLGKGEKSMAIKSYAKAIELSPNFPWPYEKLKEIKE